MFYKLSKLRSTAFLVGALALTTVSPACADSSLEARDDVLWMLSAQVNPDQDGDFAAHMSDMVAATKSESGTKSYEWFRTGDQVQILERFETNGDAGIHLANFGANFADRFTTVLKPTGLQVYGPAEGGVREALAAFGAVFNSQIGGFARD